MQEPFIRATGGYQMELDRYAKGTIAFIILIVISQIWATVSPVFKPPWQPWPPIVPFMVNYAVPFLVELYRPILIGFAAFAVLWVWEGQRAGYLLAVLFAVVASVYSVLVAVLNGMSQEWSGLFTVVVAFAVPSLTGLWYSAQGYLRYGSET